MMIKRDGSLLTATALNPNNIWAGSAYEYLGGPSLISIGVITPAAAGGLLSSTTVGGVTIAEEYLVPTDNRGAAAGAGPLASDDFQIQAAGGAMQRIVSTLRNPTGGTLTYSAVAIITPVGNGGRRR
jgi:hypothetical protein